MSMSKLGVIVTAMSASICSATARPTFGLCPGNCNGDAAVQINELITCVGMSLGALPLDTCAFCNPDGDDAVEINELILAVTFSIDTTVSVDATCVRPAAGGLQGCGETTTILVYRCDDRARCLTDPTARTPLEIGASASLGEGMFQTSVSDCRIFDSTLILAADLTETEYRVMDLGPAAASPGARLRAGTTAGRSLHVALSPSSEAAVRLLEDNGLENFGDAAVQELIAAVADANADTDFAGRDAEGAADLASETAQGDPIVQALLTAPTMTPSPTPTSLPITPPPGDDTLLSGVPVSATLAPIGDTHQYRFTLDAPMRVLLRMANVTDFLIDTCIEVRPGRFDPPVAGGVACGGFAAALDLTLQPGAYFVVIYDLNHNNEGPYDLMLQRLRADEAPPLPLDEETSDAVDQFTDVDLYSIMLAEETRILVNLRNSTDFSIDPCVAIIAPDGSSVASACGGFATRLDVVLPSGTYVVVVNERDLNNRGPYTLFLQRLTVADAVPLAADSSATVDPISDVDLYTFSLAEQSRIVLQAGHGSFAINVCIQVLPGVSEPPVEGGVACGGSSARLDDLILPAGTYFVLIHDAGHAYSGPYDLVFRTF